MIIIRSLNLLKGFEMRAVFFSFFILFFSFLSAEEVHEFRGKHMVANYLGCDSGAIADEKALTQVMLTAVEKCGAQILNHNSYVFPGHGLTMTILLSESHASLHTYPEHGKCFVDLFTCGDKCDHEVFNEVLKAYLKPQTVVAKVLGRDDEIKERNAPDMGHAKIISFAAASLLLLYAMVRFKRRKTENEVQEIKVP
ncbi:MAG: adenosylmethionine decarboxylase [Verrucomicrobia bacterium]|nr:adenosylmethionine decarboxylase [Verrucomicrobiota bacterium]